jgi:hypothetical protein
MPAGRLDLNEASGLRIDQGEDWSMTIIVNSDAQIFTMVGSPGNGTFLAAFLGNTNNAISAGFQTQTDPIAYNASSAVLQAQLERLTSIGPGNVLVTGADGGPWTVLLSDQALAETGNPLFTIDSAGLTAYGGAVGVRRGVKDLTSYVARMKIRDSEEGSELLSLTSSPLAGIVITPALGKIVISITNVQTMALTKSQGTHVYDLEIEKAGIVEAVIYGTIEVRRNITR